MSSGSSVVINELERALSGDINDLQSAERARRLADLATVNGRYGITEIIGGRSHQFRNSAGYLRTNGVIGDGLQAAVTPGVLNAFSVSPGTLVRFVAGAGPSEQDPNLFEVGRLLEPLDNVVPGGAYGGSPIPAAAPFAWLLCARIVNNTTVTLPVERFNPATQQFEVVNLPKFREGELEFQFFDADLPNPLPYPGDEWHPLWVYQANAGFIFGLTDCRQHADGPGDSGLTNPNDAAFEISFNNTIARVEYTFNGRRQGFGAGLNPVNIISSGLTLSENSEYSMLTYYARRVDGSLFRPPLLTGLPYGGANLLLADPTLLNNGTGQSNTAPVPLPASNPWSAWLATNQVDAGYGFWIGNLVTETAAPARAHRIARAGRSFYNLQPNIQGYALNQPLGNEIPRIGATAQLLIDPPGVVQNQPVSLSATVIARAPLFNVAALRAIRWRFNMNFDILGGFVRAINNTVETATLYIKSSPNAATEANLLYAGPLPVGNYDTANGGPGMKGSLETWLPATIGADPLNLIYFDIVPEGNLNQIFSILNGTVYLSYEPLEWSI